MSTRICFRFLLLAMLLGAALIALPVHALVVQQTTVTFTTPAGVETRGGDTIRVPTSADIDRDIVAGIADPGGLFSARGSVGRFGDLGIEGFQARSGEMRQQVFIESDEYVNMTPRPLEITANFIIDGGFFVMDFAPGATLRYSLTVTGNDFGSSFQTFGILTGDAAGATSFSTSGVDIGAVFDGFSRVDLPLSFQSADLGTVLPGERLLLTYQLDVVSSVPNVAEIVSYQFSDPLEVEGPGDFPRSMDFELTPVIPEPGTSLLLGLGLAGLSVRRRAAS